MTRAPMTRAELLALPVTVDVPTAARALGIGRNGAYDAIQRGDWPTRVLRLGNKIRIPTADLFRVLGIEPDNSEAGARPAPAAASAS